MANTLKTPKVMPSEFCAYGDKNTILTNPSTSNPQLANFSTGFPAITQNPIPNGGIPPERADFNGMFNLLSSALVYIQNGGQWTFVPEVSNAIGGYPAGAILNYYDATHKVNKRVISNINNNVNNFLLDPSQIGDSSKPWSYTENTPIVQDLKNPTADTIPSTKAVSDESSRIVSVMNTKVSKSGDTMNGTLIDNGVFVSQFDSVNFMARSKSLVKGTTPTDSDKYVGYDWQDKNGQRLAYLGVSYKTNGNKKLELQKLDGNLSEFYINYLIKNPYSLYFQDTRHTLGNVDVNTWFGNQIQFQDSKGTRLARIQPLLATNGTARLCLAASKGTESENSIIIGSDGYTQCPKPDNNSNTNAIATTNWAGGLNRENTWKAKNNFSVQPNVRVDGNARYKSVCNGYTKGTAPTTNQFGGISTTDKDGVEVAAIYSSIDTNNAITSALLVKQPTAAGTEAKSLSIWCDKNGSFHSYCGVQSNENNSIVTTKAHNTNYVRFGNGLQICWGSVRVGDDSHVYQNLPQAFKDTNYIVTFGHQNFTDNTTDFYHPQLTNGKKNTTNFTVYCRNANSYHNADVTWIAIGYWY